MVERKLRINPSLYISESNEWMYFTVDRKTYKVKLKEEDRKVVYELIRIINREHSMEEIEEQSRRTIFRMLIAIGAVNECMIDRDCPNLIQIQRVEHVNDVETLNQFCQGDNLRFAEGKDGLFAYLSENEVILSKKKLCTGSFCKPNLMQQQLMTQVILKNSQEICDVMSSENHVAIPLFSYSHGIRIIKEEVRDKNEMADCLYFQPWNTNVVIDEQTNYPSVLVKCKIDNMNFEAVGTDTNHALYLIYQEYKTMEVEYCE